MERKRSTGISVGASSILVVFVVLCLTAFATLSLVSANSDYKLTRRTAQAVEEYYAADSRGVECVAQLEEALNSISSQEISAAAVQLGWTSQGSVFQRQVPINTSKNLEIEVEYSNGRIDIIRWQVVNTQEWSQDDSLNLWAGENGFSALPPLS
ncbi:hypothetical protein [Youxingia wuxianensis]|uniref:Uncharacterized protein n=1 Tax=Youxingia wuxianensis TaxID=2763678 RepID=A0A926ER17_9FIRM|nr:hypothetical protein [Youxingia wuxianensis]MBC8584725.1 hypothetical protein [Youxingia wuxianensis]